MKMQMSMSSWQKNCWTESNCLWKRIFLTQKSRVS